MRTNRIMIGMALLCAALLAGGCGAEHAAKVMRDAGGDAEYNANAPAGLLQTAALEAPNEADLKQENAAAQPPRQIPAQRKIIYNARISLLVRDLDDTRKQIDALVGQRGGYLDQFSEQRNYGDRLSGHWVVRVPSAAFQDFLHDVEGLGMPESQEIQAQEVTEQFVDLEARLKAKREVEQQMLAIMKERSGEIADALEAARQLGEVRSEIEQIEGRLRKLGDLVALSTVTIDAREDENYTPPQAPTFAQSVGDVFGQSTASLLALAKGLALAAVALVPWLAVLGVVILPVFMALTMRRRRRRLKAAT